MHIAFLNPQGNFDPQDRYWTEHPDFGGQLVYVKEVALALGRMGHQADILTRLIRDPDWAGFEAREDGYPGEPNVRILRFTCGGTAFMRKEQLWPHLGTEWVPNIVKYYREHGPVPEAATTHYGDGGLAGALWHQAGGPPFSFTAHSLGAQKLDRLLEAGTGSLDELEAHFHFRARLAAERTAMSHADRVITSTRQEREQQYGHGAYRPAIDPADDERFAVVPPGVNLSVFDLEAAGPDDPQIAEHIDRMLARDLSPARVDLPAVICSSRLDRKKNHLGLVQAFAHSTKLRTAANLLMVVRGVDSLQDRGKLSLEERVILDEINELVDQAQLRGALSVFSLESQGELAAAYRYLRERRAVFCLTALYEPFGLAPLEAMAAGLPAVVTRNGGPSESLREDGQEFGVLVDPNDPGAIADGLLRLVGDPDEWQRMQQRGRQRVLQRYTWERTAQGYLDNLQPRSAERKRSAPGAERPPIPTYFSEPTPENEAALPRLGEFWPQTPVNAGEGASG